MPEGLTKVLKVRQWVIGRAGEEGCDSNWGLGLIFLPYSCTCSNTGKGNAPQGEGSRAFGQEERSLSMILLQHLTAAGFALPDRIWATRPYQIGTCEETHPNSKWNLEWALVPSLYVSPEGTGVGKGGDNIYHPPPPHHSHDTPDLPSQEGAPASLGVMGSVTVPGLSSHSERGEGTLCNCWKCDRTWITWNQLLELQNISHNYNCSATAL